MEPIQREMITLIEQQKGQVRIADLTLKFKEPVIELKYHLHQLAEHHLADITVDDSGDLIYQFNFKDAAITEKLRKGALWLAKGLYTLFKWGFKVAIMLTLVFYTIFYTLILLGLLLKSDSDVDIDFSPLLANLLNIFLHIFVFYREPIYEGSGKVPFHIRVYQFVFGPPKRKPVDHRALLTSYLKRSPIITVAHGVNITGLPEQEVSRLLVGMVAAYEGEIAVNDDGIIYYTFDAMKFTDQTYLKHDIWNNLEAQKVVTGNKTKDNWKVIGLNTFNLIMSAVFFNYESIVANTNPEHADVVAQIGTPSFSVMFWLSYFPLMFSITLFAVPAIRYFKTKRDNMSINRQNTVYKLLKQFHRTVWADQHHFEANRLTEEVKEDLRRDYPELLPQEIDDNGLIVDLSVYGAALKLRDQDRGILDEV